MELLSVKSASWISLSAESIPFADEVRQTIKSNR
jgi:hypothetical protein